MAITPRAITNSKILPYTQIYTERKKIKMQNKSMNFYAKRNIKNISKKTRIILTTLFIVMGVILFVGAFCLVYFNQNVTQTEREFTFVKYTKKPAYKTWHYELYVAEETKPLNLSTFATHRIDVNALQNLKNGDKIICKTIDGDTPYRYEVSNSL